MAGVVRKKEFTRWYDGGVSDTVLDEREVNQMKVFENNITERLFEQHPSWDENFKEVMQRGGILPSQATLSFCGNCQNLYDQWVYGEGCPFC